MMDTRYGRVDWGPHGVRVRTSDANWRKPVAWNKAAAGASERPRVFCASLADWADTHHSISHFWREDLGDLIEATPNLDWLLLTKRIGNADDVLGEMFAHQVPRNVWIGLTVVNQQEADRDIPKLLSLKVKRGISLAFLSIEPLLGQIVLPSSFLIDLVIVGGESGPNARPMHPNWARSLRDQCALAGSAFYFKQWGEWLPHYFGRPDRGEAETLVGDTSASARLMFRAGKKAAARLLDGREHNGMPSRSATDGRA
jgi:protein gp37